MDFQGSRFQLLILITGVVALSFGAEKCRQLVGEEASSQSGKFTILNCFDMSSGTVACAVKESVKLYSYNIRSIHAEKLRNRAIEGALTDALSQGMSPKDAAKEAQKAGVKAAKLASRQVKRIVGPIISSGWDFFEALYYGGTIPEGILRGTGTLFGTYIGGLLGEQRFGKFGYLVGSHLGSWIGGRIGLMVYDVYNGIQFVLSFVDTDESEVHEAPIYESSETSEDSSAYEAPMDSSTYEAPEYSADGASKESFAYEGSRYDDEL